MHFDLVVIPRQRTGVIPPHRAFGGIRRSWTGAHMDRDAEWVEFSHDAMAGPGPVRVRQNLDAVDGIARGDDATARWVWPGATATARWLCDRKTEWIEGKHVVEIGSGTGLLGECTVSPVDPNSVASLLTLVKVRHP